MLASFRIHRPTRSFQLARCMLAHSECRPSPSRPAPQADKRFQLADWRARPLTPEMLHYARADTHYLLYCYDRLKVRTS